MTAIYLCNGRRPIAPVTWSPAPAARGLIAEQGMDGSGALWARVRNVRAQRVTYRPMRPGAELWRIGRAA